MRTIVENIHFIQDGTMVFGDLYLENGYVELIGNAHATQDGNSVTGDKLRLTNSNVAVADGNVKIIYIPEEQPAKTSEEKQDLA